MLIEADFVWGELVTPRCVRFRGALPPREKPSRQRQPFALPCFCFGYAGIPRAGSPSRAARRLAQLLRPRRMNILAKRRGELCFEFLKTRVCRQYAPTWVPPRMDPRPLKEENREKAEFGPS